PLSLIGTLGGMYLLGYSLDNLSLMALTVSTGFVVDDAIVVLENITRYLEAGDSPREAALKGSREIGFTVLSMSTSLVAVGRPLQDGGGDACPLDLRDGRSPVAGDSGLGGRCFDRAPDHAADPAPVPPRRGPRPPHPGERAGLRHRLPAIPGDAGLGAPPPPP